MGARGGRILCKSEPLCRASAQNVTALLEGASLVWLNGGETEALVHTLRSTGLADAIASDTRKGRFVLAGRSAGTIAAGASARIAAVEPNFFHLYGDNFTGL